jgi:hypothetical protein
MTRGSPLFATILFMLAGCATPPPQGPMVNDTSFYLGRFDKVWEVTMKVLEKKSLEVKEFDRENGEITTRFTNYSVGPKAHHELDKIAERPEVRLGLYTQVGYSVSIKIIAVNDMSTQVKIRANIEAYDTNATRKWHPCKSKGVIERELLERIRGSL